MSIKLSNYYRRTPKWAKNIGDAALISIPLVSSAIMSAPMDETTKLWMIFVCNILLAVVKFITKLVGEEPIEQEELRDES